MPRTSIVVGAATAAAALALTACAASGTGGNGSKDDAFTLVTTTADKTMAEKNAKVAFVIDETLGSDTIHFNGTGVADLIDNAVKLTFPIPAGSGVSGSVDELVVDGIYYLHLPAALRSKVGGHEWVSMDPKKVTGATSYNTDLMSNLTALKAASRQVTEVGTQDVRGVKTTHYHAIIDLARAWRLHGIQAQTIEKYRASLGDTLPEDVYLDDQGLTRRMEVTIAPKSGSPEAGTVPKMHLTIDFYDFGKADTSGIVKPPIGKTVDFSKTPLAHAG